MRKKEKRPFALFIRLSEREKEIIDHLRAYYGCSYTEVIRIAIAHLFLEIQQPTQHAA